jgi:hypothetical protein
MADLHTLATQFVEYYYREFKSDRNNLKPLYVSWDFKAFFAILIINPNLLSLTKFLIFSRKTFIKLRLLF